MALSSQLPINSVRIVKRESMSPHLGEFVRDEDGKGSFPNIEVLEKCGFEDKGHGVFVPFSFTSSRADEFFAKELKDALTEKPKADSKPSELQDGNAIEATFKVK